jgi:hypothetical protein
MPQLRITQPHHLSQDEAVERLKKKRDEIIQKGTYTVSDVKENWTSPCSLDFSFKILGFSLTGSVAAKESTVDIDIDLPLVAMMMKGTIESQVKQELTKVLA